jgi:hypothetical protein
MSLNTSAIVGRVLDNVKDLISVRDEPDKKATIHVEGEFVNQGSQTRCNDI